MNCTIFYLWFVFEQEEVSSSRVQAFVHTLGDTIVPPSAPQPDTTLVLEADTRSVDLFVQWFNVLRRQQLQEGFSFFGQP